MTIAINTVQEDVDKNEADADAAIAAVQAGKWSGDTNIYYNGGNVGIGKTDPTQALDITGNVAVSGTVDGVDVSTLSSTVNSLKSNVNNNHLAYQLVSEPDAIADAQDWNGKGNEDYTPNSSVSYTHLTLPTNREV